MASYAAPCKALRFAPPALRAAFERGALGFIPKSSAMPVILNALRLVLSGGTYVPREIIGSAAPPAAPAPPPELFAC